MKKIKMTPETFVDLFILCLSWQWEPTGLARTWTTVDKVQKILLGLGIITEDQVATTRSEAYRLCLRRNVAVLVTARYRQNARLSSDELDDGVRNVLSQKQKLCVQLRDANANSNVKHLMACRIHLTYAGAAYAKGLASQFAPWLTHETYLAEKTRQETLLLGKEVSISKRKQADSTPAITRLW